MIKLSFCQTLHLGFTTTWHITCSYFCVNSSRRMKLPLALLIGLGLVLASSVQGGKVRYDNYKLYRFTPSDAQGLKLLNQLHQDNFGLIFWKAPSVVGKSVDIMFPPHLQGDTLEFLKNQIPSSVMSDNVQMLIDVEAKGILENGMRLDWDNYGTLDNIYDFLEEEAAAHSEIAQVESIGKSYEDRDLKLIKISKPSQQPKPAIWIDGGLHAREWISSAVATYVINQLLNNDTDADLVKITEDFDLYVIPVLNPDGYAYTHTNNRLWLKTRSRPNSPFGCRGANGNCNWGYQFNTGGTSSDPCSDIYHGGTAHSQVEVNATAEFYSRIAGQTKMYITLHSYGQVILFPYGYSNVRHPDYEPWMRIGQAVAEAIKKPYGTHFTVANIADLEGPFSGSSGDWVTGTHNTSVVFTFELKDTEEHGFLLPPEQIKPSGIEFLEGLKELVQQLRSRLGMS